MRQIGYWGVPGTVARTKTHLVEDGKNLCGVPVGRKAEFQFCSPPSLTLAECARCRAKQPPR